MGRACKSRQHSNIRYLNITALHHIFQQAQRDYKPEDFLPVDAIWSIPQSCWFNTNSWGEAVTALLSLGNISITGKLVQSRLLAKACDLRACLFWVFALTLAPLCWLQGNWASVLRWERYHSPMLPAAFCKLMIQTLLSVLTAFSGRFSAFQEQRCWLWSYNFLLWIQAFSFHPQLLLQFVCITPSRRCDKTTPEHPHNDCVRPQMMGCVSNPQGGWGFGKKTASV